MSSNWFNETGLAVARLVLARSSHVNNLLNAIVTSFENFPAPGASIPGTKGFGEVFEIVAPTANAHPARQTDVLNNATTYAADSGAANAYVVTLSPAPPGFVAGLEFTFKATNANTGGSTVNLNALGNKAIKHNDGSALSAGDIPAGGMITVKYDGTNFQIASGFSGAAEASAAAALVSENNAGTSETNAAADLVSTNADVVSTGDDVVTCAASVVLAEEWASNPEDDPITGHPGEYSALHWAAKSAASAVSAALYMPSGAIIMWSGAISAIPTGFVICDGTSGTPNLTDRFILHADADSGGTNNVGDTGTGSGAADGHTLITSEMPSHTHEYIVVAPGTGLASGANFGSNDLATSSIGGNGSHSHNITDYKPKYYALAYIMKS